MMLGADDEAQPREPAPWEERPSDDGPLQGDPSSDAGSTVPSTALVQAALSLDAMHLALYLEPAAFALPRPDLVEMIMEACDALHLDEETTATVADAYLQVCSPGSWITVRSGTPSLVSNDGYVELFTPLSLDSDNEFQQERRFAVHQDTAVARLHPGQRGTTGRDLLGREVPVNEPREASLLSGQHTYIDENGEILRSACGGEVVLRDRRLEIIPMNVIDAESVLVNRPVHCEGNLFVRGSVGTNRAVEASGDVYVDGHVYEASVRSLGGSISVHGSVSGNASAESLLEAGGDVTCGTLLHAHIRAKGDVHLLTHAQWSTIEADGNVYARRRIEESLANVNMKVSGGVIAPEAPPARGGPAPTVRQDRRLMLEFPGEVALHGVEPLDFHSCTIEDLSISGARCRVEATMPSAALHQGTLVQLKCALPQTNDHVVAIGRVARQVDDGRIGIAFIELPMRESVQRFLDRDM